MAESALLRIDRAVAPVKLDCMENTMFFLVCMSCERWRR